MKNKGLTSGVSALFGKISQRLKFLEHGAEGRENIVEPVPWVSTSVNDTVPKMVTAGQKEGSKAGFAG